MVWSDYFVVKSLNWLNWKKKKFSEDGRFVNSANQSQMFTASRCYAAEIMVMKLWNYMHMVISCIVVALRMCDTTDPSRAAELYITASEMNVVRSHCLLLKTNLPTI